MKNKIIDTLGFIIIIYGLSIGFTLLQSMLDVSTALAIFVLLPMPYFIAIYLYKGIQELKHDYKQIIEVYEEQDLERMNEIATKDKQIANHITLNGVRIARIDKLDIEITDLKRELSSVAKKEVLKCTSIHISDTGKLAEQSYNSAHSITFSQDYDNTEELHICPDCQSEMRECKTMYICKNLTCKKRVKKATLSATEVMT